MSEYVLAEAAVLDLEDIWDYIAPDSMEAADRWIGKLFDAFAVRLCHEHRNGGRAV